MTMTFTLRGSVYRQWLGWGQIYPLLFFFLLFISSISRSSSSLVQLGVLFGVFETESISTPFSFPSSLQQNQNKCCVENTNTAGETMRYTTKFFNSWEICIQSTLDLLYSLLMKNSNYLHISF